jgi:hypothetical protein
MFFALLAADLAAASHAWSRVVHSGPVVERALRGDADAWVHLTKGESMAAFVVVAPAGTSNAPRSGCRLNIFPGSATPSVFAAGTPFWIGYGFVPEAGDGGPSVHPDTGFELLVDGQAVPLHTDVEIEDGHRVRKFTIADFRHGLPAGWHLLAGRWYDAGVLALTSDRSVEFVER